MKYELWIQTDPGIRFYRIEGDPPRGKALSSDNLFVRDYRLSRPRPSR